MTEGGAERLLLVTSGASGVVAYACREARAAARDRGGPVVLDAYVPDEATAERVRRHAAGEGVEATATVGPATVAAVAAHVADGRATAVLVDPDAGVPPGRLAAGLGSEVTVQRVPVERETERRRLVHEGGVARFVATFLLSYGFYLVLGDPFDPFDLVTGAVTAGVVAVALSSVLFEEPPSVGRTLPRALRATLFVPYLLVAVVRANLAVAAVVLSPSLPVDPEIVEVESAATGAFERAVLANAVTLTPGTLALDVRDGRLRVHTLTAASREGLREGSLARAVAFVFHGRAGP